MVSGRLLLSDTCPRDMVVRMRKVIAIHHGADEMHETLVFKPFSCHYDGSSLHEFSCYMQ